jgi:hypothetical protein
MRARIDAASVKAVQLFRVIHREDAGAVKALRDKHIVDLTTPELFEVYQAYYNDLYRRTPIMDKNGKIQYKQDEHILNRDAYGNLVSLYNADGSPREVPQIVYYQAEFQVIEQNFTELMCQEFEEQRGLKY